MEAQVDGFDLGNIGFVVQAVPGWRDAVGYRVPTRQKTDALGVAPVSAREQAGGRSLEIRGWQAADDRATLLDRRDELLHRLWGADIEIVLPDDTGRVFFCRVDGKIEVQGIQPALTQEAHRLRIPVLLEDPRIYSAAEESLTIASDDASATAVPLGTAPTEASFEVDQTAFTLTYRDSDGNVVATLEVSGASTTPVTVDMADQTIITSGGGEIDTLASGDFFPFDPRDGDYPNDTWPTIEIATGTGGVATASVSFRKAWL